MQRRIIDSAPSQGLSPNELKAKAQAKHHIDIAKTFFLLLSVYSRDREAKAQQDEQFSVVFHPSAK